ncbi:TPA: phosphatase PAP2 family protein [Vibrio cholerae]|uniref:undecaprenyl-diphosphate phosphatase n=1 Tax=Vibrio paracholerae TaxID=650003 RepID=A0ABX9FF77_9VIBR|nr:MULTISPECIES: phosphatase PAP2 family protein [Vibrio]EGQ8591059.1 phosphatase PAP2 family protein [Vibrio cholerae]EGQ8660210.1 phosphatase PAP2 family protein [Vibrio cholerae]EGR4076136.1 phosphatase PAP2 family protein [Vibrio cholerae]EGR5062177.1 phosphatase PAP2 family protein [Vibrio cholerae]MBN7285186.1 phosphatase PAP2 family protein [Vibrio paracholerae]
MKARIMSCKRALVLLLTFILLLIPLTLLSLQLDFTQPVSDSVGRAMTYLTHSAGKEGFLFTLLFLVCWVGWRCQIPRHQWLNKSIQLMLLLGLAMVLKVGMKAVTQEPRPYTELMTQSLLLPNAGHFYKLAKPKQEALLLEMEEKVSHWRVMHWQGETDFSFPSGHTVFAMVCLLYFGSLLAEKKRYLSLGALLIWVSGVAYSRLWLGMHHPVDLLGAALLVGVLYLLVPQQYPLQHPRFKPWLRRWHLV